MKSSPFMPAPLASVVVVVLLLAAYPAWTAVLFETECIIDASFYKDCDG
jgi:hypothetical protein